MHHLAESDPNPFLPSFRSETVRWRTETLYQRCANLVSDQTKTIALSELLATTPALRPLRRQGRDMNMRVISFMIFTWAKCAKPSVEAHISTY